MVGVAHAPRESEIRPGDTGDSVVSPCQRDPSIDEPPDAHGDGQGDHEKIDPCRPQCQASQQGRQAGGDQDAVADGRQKGELVFCNQNRSCVSSDCKKGDVAERPQAGISDENVQAHGHNGINKALGK